MEGLRTLLTTATCAIFFSPAAYGFQEEPIRIKLRQNAEPRFGFSDPSSDAPRIRIAPVPESNSPADPLAQESAAQVPGSASDDEGGAPEYSVSEQKLLDAIRRRKAIEHELNGVRRDGDAQTEVKLARELRTVEQTILKLGKSTGRVPDGELTQLRDQHLGLLKWLADHSEVNDLDSAAELWNDSLQQLTALNGPDHWMTRTARAELNRIQTLRKLEPAKRREFHRAAALTLEFAKKQSTVSPAKLRPLVDEIARLHLETIGPDHARSGAALNNQALVMADMGEWGRADQVFDHVLQIYRSTIGSQHPEYATTLSNHADLLKHTARFEQAEKSELAAQRIIEKVYGRSSRQYVQSLLKVSTIAAAAGKLPRALQLLEEVESRMADSDDTTNYDRINFYAHQSAVLRQQGEYDRALHAIRRALELTEAEAGGNSPAFAKLRNNLGLILIESGKLAEADQVVTEARVMVRQSFGTQHPQYAVALTNEANLRQEQGRLREAELLLTEAIQILDRTAGRHHPAMATIMNNLALVKIEQRQLTQAAALLEAALKIERDTLSETHPAYIITLENAARLQQVRQNKAAALQLVEQAVDVGLQIYGEEHPEHARHLMHLSEFLTESRKLGAAEAAARQGAKILGEELGRRHPEYADALINVGRVYQAMQQPDRAERMMAEGVRILEEELGKQHPEYARALVEFGGYYNRIKDYETSEELLSEGAQILAERLGKQHPEHAQAIRQLAVVTRNLKNPQEAEKLLVQAAQSLAVSVGRQHPEYVETLRELVVVYDVMQRPDRSEWVRDRIEAITAVWVSEAEDQAVAKLNAELERVMRRSGLQIQATRPSDGSRVPVKQ